MPPALPRAVLLDLDDTVLVFDSASPQAWSAACRRFADRLDGVTPEQGCSPPSNRRGCGTGATRRATSRADWTSSAPGERSTRGALAARRHLRRGTRSRDVGEAYSEERIAAVRPIPGALDVLTRLRSAGVATALVTNGGAAGQRAKIERFGLEPFFDHILIEGEFGTGKPDRGVFLHVLERLNVAPQEAWMVGDRLDFDIETPKLLGMHAVWIDVKRTGVPDDTAVRPDRVIGSIAELLPVECLSIRRSLNGAAHLCYSPLVTSTRHQMDRAPSPAHIRRMP